LAICFWWVAAFSMSPDLPRVRFDLVVARNYAGGQGFHDARQPVQPFIRGHTLTVAD